MTLRSAIRIRRERQTASHVPYLAHVSEHIISTGAGDHFNAGFSMGQVLGFNLEESLCCGVGTSGYYVRSAQSPSIEKIAAMMLEPA